MYRITYQIVGVVGTFKTTIPAKNVGEAEKEFNRAVPNGIITSIEEV